MLTTDSRFYRNLPFPRSLILVTLIIGIMAIGCNNDQPIISSNVSAVDTTSPVYSSRSQDTSPKTPTKVSQTTNLRNLKGDIQIDGSSTVFPITEAVAEEFGYLTEGNVRVVVGVSGSGGGFKRFCAGETDFSNASRAIKQEEVDMCAEAGIEYIEIPVAMDGLSVMVNPQNDFVSCITEKELNTMWRPESEDIIKTWNHINPDWPDEKLQLYGPGVDSGTFDYFTETINGESQASRGDFVASEDDNVLVHGISGDQNSLGYFGYAYYVENMHSLKIVGIDGGDGCVKPTPETINNGTYKPLSRALFIYVRKDSALKPHIQEFIRYYLSADGGQPLASEVGYIPLPSRVYELAQSRVDSGLTGTLFGGSTPQKGDIEDVLSK